MARARRARTQILYQGRDLSRFVIDFTYTDNYDQTDDISMTLADRDKRWASDWFPETGEIIDATIQLFDWNREGDNRSLSLGTFEIDNIGFSDTVSINAVAAPITSSIRSEKKNRTWKDISLKNIATDMADGAVLKLAYKTKVNPFYDVADQNGKSDLEFLEDLCKSDGLCLKVSARQLIVFEEAKFEAEPTRLTIHEGISPIIDFPKFRRNAKDVYKACEVAHFDPKTDKTYVGFFEAPCVGNVGHTLKLREQFNSESDDINLDRKARARLREKNKNEWTCNLRMHGDIIYFTGVNVDIKGWHRFDGKYHITTCSHSIGSGYSVNLSLRKCLEGY